MKVLWKVDVTQMPSHCQIKKRGECEFKPGTWKPLVSVGARSWVWTLVDDLGKGH